MEAKQPLLSVCGRALMIKVRGHHSPALVSPYKEVPRPPCLHYLEFPSHLLLRTPERR